MIRLSLVALLLFAGAAHARGTDRELLDRRERARTYVPTTPTPALDCTSIVIIVNGAQIRCE
jgi:hypothetical protein